MDAARHGRAGRHQRLEPLRWLMSGASRCWRWVWSAEHDDLEAAVAAWLAQFAVLATLSFAVVITSR